eukprot:TRINITY_DN23503_c0_g1_i4.p1 TRINITY_DN23503_c0_g1~~TRINITY_DN23503_c0_g1_i4.p1  ORF type:complete len:1797 (-),score=440.48 TRINITY_DN23503_c0_g1_i4:196-5586(-)
MPERLLTTTGGKQWKAVDGIQTRLDTMPPAVHTCSGSLTGFRNLEQMDFVPAVRKESSELASSKLSSLTPRTTAEGAHFLDDQCRRVYFKTPEKDRPNVYATVVDEHCRNKCAVIKAITADILDAYMPTWRSQKHRHLTFVSKSFRLQSLDSLLEQPIDLAHLDTLDLSHNALQDLGGIEGLSDQLNRLGCVQGTIRFQSLTLLRAQYNNITQFVANLPYLRELDLSHNALTFLPPMSGLTTLEVLNLGHNQMHGSWTSLQHLQGVRKLDLSHNHFHFLPSEYEIMLQHLHGLPFLVALKLVGNNFAIHFPEYQSFTLSRLPGLKKLDDIADMAAAKIGARATDHGNIRMLDKFVFARRKAIGDRARSGWESVGAGDQKGPTFKELVEEVSRAFEDPAALEASIKQIVNIANAIYDASVPTAPKHGVLNNFFGIGQPSDLKMEGPITAFLHSITLLYSRLGTDNSAHGIMILRSLAKLGVVSKQNFGQYCLQQLAWMAKRNREEEQEIFDMVREIVIEPLSARDPRNDVAVEIVKALSTFDSPAFPERLTTLVPWLKEAYCNHSQGQPQISRLFAIAVRDQRNCSLALGELNGTGLRAPTPSKGGETVPTHVNMVLGDEKLLYTDKKEASFLDNLEILKRTIMYSEAACQQYRTYGLHRKLVRLLKGFYGMPAQDEQNAKGGGQQPALSPPASTQEVRSCVALLDALTCFLEKDDSVLQELINTPPPLVSILDFFTLAPKSLDRSVFPDPAWLGASLEGLVCVLNRFPREPARWRRAIVEKIIDAVASMSDLIDCIDSTSHYYSELFQSAEKHVMEQKDEQAGTEKQQGVQLCPKLSGLTNPLMHNCFVAIVRLAEVFTVEGKVDDACSQVNDVMNAKDREKRLFKLLEVPCGKVRAAAISCVSQVDLSDMSSDEVGFLISLLASCSEVAQQASLLSKVIRQLTEIANDKEGKGANAALRKHHAEGVITAVFHVLSLNSARTAHGLEKEEKSKFALSQSAVHFLQVASRVHELRNFHMRSAQVQAKFEEILCCEDRIGLPSTPDVPLERTWTGRAVEPLMQCLSGIKRLNPHGKVAFRVASRIANVLEGRNDIKDDPEEKDLDSNNGTGEIEMFSKSSLKGLVRNLDSIEEDDWEMQQQMFVSFHGFHRLLTFAGDLESAEQRQLSRKQETIQKQEASAFLEATTTQASTLEGQKSEGGFGAPLLGGIGNGAAGQIAATDDGLPAVTFRGQAFLGREVDFVDLALPPYSFTPLMGGAMSIAFAARWDSLKRRARIVDFGSGCPGDNIIIANENASSTLEFKIYRGNDPKNMVILQVPRAIIVGQLRRYLFTVNAAGRMKAYRDGELLAENEAGKAPAIARRSRMLVGKSAWPGDELFVGHIANLRVWMNQAVDWDSAGFDEDEEESSQPKRRYLMRALNAASTEVSHPPKQELQLHNAHGEGVHAVTEVFLTRPSEGVANPAYLLSAIFRSAFALLQQPAAESIRKEMLTILRDDIIASRIPALLETCNIFDCNVAAKMLRVMRMSFNCPDASQMTLEPKHLISYDLLVKCVLRLLQPTLVAHAQRRDPLLRQRAHVLGCEIVALVATICQTVPACSFGIRSEEAHLAFVQSYLQRLVNPEVTKFILTLIVQEQEQQAGPTGAGGTAGSMSARAATAIAASARNIGRSGASPRSTASAKLATRKPSSVHFEMKRPRSDKLLESSRTVFAILLCRCPEQKYFLLESFSRCLASGTTPLRRSYLAGVLRRARAFEDALAIEKALNSPEIARTMPRPAAVLATITGHADTTPFLNILLA